MENARELYEALKTKYELPDFEELDYEMELDLSETRFLLRAIRDRITETVHSHAKQLEEALQPESSLSKLYECQYIDEEYKKEIFDIYRTLKAIERYSHELSIDNSEENNAKFIMASFKEWTELKPRLKKFYVKMKDSWKEEIDSKNIQEYFG